MFYNFILLNENSLYKISQSKNCHESERLEIEVLIYVVIEIYVLHP